jgi:hypothetical protein
VLVEGGRSTSGHKPDHNVDGFLTQKGRTGVNSRPLPTTSTIVETPESEAKCLRDVRLEKLPSNPHNPEAGTTPSSFEVMKTDRALGRGPQFTGRAGPPGAPESASAACRRAR